MCTFVVGAKIPARHTPVAILRILASVLALSFKAWSPLASIPLPPSSMENFAFVDAAKQYRKCTWGLFCRGAVQCRLRPFACSVPVGATGLPEWCFLRAGQALWTGHRDAGGPQFDISRTPSTLGTTPSTLGTTPSTRHVCVDRPQSRPPRPPCAPMGGLEPLGQ